LDDFFVGRDRFFVAPGLRQPFYREGSKNQKELRSGQGGRSVYWPTSGTVHRRGRALPGDNSAAANGGDLGRYAPALKLANRPNVYSGAWGRREGANRKCWTRNRGGGGGGQGVLWGRWAGGKGARSTKRTKEAEREEHRRKRDPGRGQGGRLKRGTTTPT